MMYNIINFVFVGNDMDFNEIKTKYRSVRVLDKDEKGTVELIEYEGRNCILRTMNGQISSYKALKNISSPYLPRIEYAEYENGRTIVIEEYIEGERNISSLNDEKAIVTAFCELCDVLTVLHSRNIIHRDVKPSNILIAPDGHIRLIDFDASRYYDDGKDSDTRYLGTKGYAPPEQFGYSQTDATADIYSLGVTLRNVLGEKAEKRKFSRIIRKCTEFAPKNRYQSAAAVKKALCAHKIGFIPPILVGSAAVAMLILYFVPAYFSPTPQSTAPSEVETSSLASAETFGTASSASETTSKTTKPTTQETTTVPESKYSLETVETTTVPESESASETEKTTVVPESEPAVETEETTVTAETSETLAETTTTAVTASSATKPQTSKTEKTAKTSKTTKVTKEKAASVSATEEETTAKTTAESTKTPPPGTILMTNTTDKHRTLGTVRIKVNKEYYDELTDPWEFDIDEAVVGTWRQLTYTAQGTPVYDKMYYKKLTRAPYLDIYREQLRFDEDGTCIYIHVYPSSGTIYSGTFNWTYGLIEIREQDDNRLYEHYYLYVTEDGHEYLFVEHKSGDYVRAPDPVSGLSYTIYERETEV